MNDIQQWGIDFILALQSHQSPLLDSIFNLVTQLGSYGYLLVIPLLIWCIEPRLGLRSLLAMLIAQYIVMLLKDIVQEPRPFMVDSRIISTGEHGYSFPSGHAMGSLVFYGLVLLWTDKQWLRGLLAIVIILTGLSRNYLGVHYPHDILAGWGLGIVFIYGWLKLERFAAGNIRMMHISRQRIFAVLLPAIIATIHYYQFDYVGVVALAGATSAALLSLIVDRKKKSFNVEGNLVQKLGRYVVGISLTLGVFFGFKHIYPSGAGLLYNMVLWCNGVALVLVPAYMVPWLLPKIKLSSS